MQYSNYLLSFQLKCSLNIDSIHFPYWWMFFLKIDQLPVFTSYLFVIGQFVLKVISYWLTANNRKLINFLSTQFFNLRKCIESIFEEHYNWNDSKQFFRINIATTQSVNNLHFQGDFSSKNHNEMTEWNRNFKYKKFYSRFQITFHCNIPNFFAKFENSLRSSKVHFRIHKPVCKQRLWLVPELNEADQM